MYALEQYKFKRSVWLISCMFLHVFQMLIIRSVCICTAFPCDQLVVRHFEITFVMSIEAVCYNDLKFICSSIKSVRYQACGHCNRELF